jgi:hypothetical protein
MAKLGKTPNPTKADFNKVFNELRKWGYTVINFSDKRALRKGMKDWVDYTIFGKRLIIFIELKIDKDKLSSGQTETALKLTEIAERNSTVIYKQIKTLQEATFIVDYLLRAKNG